MEKSLERSLARRIIRSSFRSLREDGFVHSKPTFAVRPTEYLAAFIHIHKFSYGPMFRLHFGIRVLNDPFEAVALNGLSLEHAGKYSAQEENIERCIGDIERFIRGDGLPWLIRYGDIDSLLASETPLKERDRVALEAHLSGSPSIESVKQTSALLGLDKHF